MALSTGPARGSWISTAGRQEWDRAAEVFSQAAGRVEDAARHSVSNQMVRPMVGAIRSTGHGEVADALARTGGVFTEGGQMYFGLPDDHPAAGRAAEMEWGTEEQLPAPHLRSAWWTHGGAAQDAFEQYLWAGAPQ